MMQLGEKLSTEGGEVPVGSRVVAKGPGKDAAVATNSKVKRSLNGDQLVPGTVSKPTTPLPCPRCESLNTKFCYYNNYSVTQPRHFCRQCQRYWTAGGTLRNVPVGGGSRKKSRHSRTSEPAYPNFMAQPGNPMAATGFPPQNMFPNVGFQHLMPAPDMAGFTFAGHPNMGASMHSMYGTTEPAMVAMPMQMRPGGENSDPNPNPNSAPKPELVENNVDVVDVKIKNGSSPPHGSSTIEEEGSTPTNGYSNSGYEEGDAVSSMWHEMHVMDNVLFQ